MADISYANEAWMTVHPEDVSEGDIILYTPTKLNRRHNPLPTVAVVTAVEEDDRSVFIDIKISAARTVLMAAPRGYPMNRVRVYKRLGG
jgi:hypothetical protein